MFSTIAELLLRNIAYFLGICSVTVFLLNSTEKAPRANVLKVPLYTALLCLIVVGRIGLRLVGSIGLVSRRGDGGPIGFRGRGLGRRCGSRGRRGRRCRGRCRGRCRCRGRSGSRSRRSGRRGQAPSKGRRPMRAPQVGTARPPAGGKQSPSGDLLSARENPYPHQNFKLRLRVFCFCFPCFYRDICYNER